MAFFFPSLHCVTSPSSVCPNHQHSKSSCSIGSDLPGNNGSTVNCLMAQSAFAGLSQNSSYKESSRFLRRFSDGSQGSTKCELPGGPTAGNRLLGGARPLCHRRWPSQAPDTSDGRKWHSPALPRRTPGRADSLGRGGAGADRSRKGAAPFGPICTPLAVGPC